MSVCPLERHRLKVMWFTGFRAVIKGQDDFSDQTSAEYGTTEAGVREFVEKYQPASFKASSFEIRKDVGTSKHANRRPEQPDFEHFDQQVWVLRTRSPTYRT